MPKSVQIIGSNGKVLELDSVCAQDIHQGHLVTVSETEHRVHIGECFSCYDYDSDVDTVKYWHLKTPDLDIVTYVEWKAISSKSGTLEMFRDSVVSNNGVELCTESENPCACSGECCFKTYKDPIVTNEGTRVSVFVMGSDSTAVVAGSGGEAERKRMLVLKPNTSYLCKFTPRETNTRISFGITFFEARK